MELSQFERHGPIQVVVGDSNLLNESRLTLRNMFPSTFGKSTQPVDVVRPAPASGGIIKQNHNIPLLNELQITAFQTQVERIFVGEPVQRTEPRVLWGFVGKGLGIIYRIKNCAQRLITRRGVVQVRGRDVVRASPLADTDDGEGRW